MVKQSAVLIGNTKNTHFQGKEKVKNNRCGKNKTTEKSGSFSFHCGKLEQRKLYQVNYNTGHRSFQHYICETNGQNKKFIC